MSSQFSLRPHQHEAVAWLAKRYRALIHDDPGCGKTAQSIVAADSFGWGTQVICPAVALGVWAREIRQVAPHASVRVQETREPVAPPRPGEWLLTTYDRASLAVEPGVRPERFGVILDEAHYVKNLTTQRSKRCRDVIEVCRGYVWAMTGTPILRDPDDLWAQMDLLGIAKQAYRSRAAFDIAFGGTRVPELGRVWSRPTDAAWAPLDPLRLCRKREQILTLPARTHEDWYLDISQRDAAHFRQITERYPVDDEMWERPEAPGELSQALDRLSAVKAAAALPHIAELHATPHDPIVIFCAHRSAVLILQTKLGWPTITGETSHEDRTRIENEFQAGKHAGLICTIQAAGVALTLTRARVVLFVGRTFIPAANSQAADRVYRIGQEREVRAIVCRADSPLEIAIDKVLKRKMPYVIAPASPTAS